MTQFTPGPWRLSSQEGDTKRYLVADDTRYGQSTGVSLIAQIKIHRLGSADRVAPDEIQDANARLIAAAPDMLAALQRAAYFFDTPVVKTEENAIRGEVLAAIAKAIGAA